MESHHARGEVRGSRGLSPEPRWHVPRWRAALAVQLALLMMASGGLLISGCGAADSGGGAAAPARPESTPDPSRAGVRADRDQLAAYRRRCGRLLNDAGEARARIVYPATAKMDIGDARTIAAKVTLDQETPASQLLDREDAAEKRGVVVSCLLDADPGRGRRVHSGAAWLGAPVAVWRTRGVVLGRNARASR